VEGTTGARGAEGEGTTTEAEGTRKGVKNGWNDRHPPEDRFVRGIFYPM
jgi:hypothetical protein